MYRYRYTKNQQSCKVAKCATTLRDLSWKGIGLFDNTGEDSKEASTNNNDDKLECSENNIETIEQSFNKTNVLHATVLK